MQTITEDDWCKNLFPENYRAIRYLASERKIDEYFSEVNDKLAYIYDHSNHWEHLLTVEKIVTMHPDKKYPNLVDGRGGCPPEGEILL